MAHTLPLFFEQGEISFHHGGGELVRLKVFTMSGSLGNPCSELTQDTRIGVNSRFVVLGKTSLLIAQYPLFIPCTRKGNDVRRLRHFLSFPPVKFSAASFASSFAELLKGSMRTRA